MYGPPGTGKTVSAEVLYIFKKTKGREEGIYSLSLQAIGFETGKPLKVINTAELVSKYPQLVPPFTILS
jgi:hypothetical protein